MNTRKKLVSEEPLSPLVSRSIKLSITTATPCPPLPSYPIRSVHVDRKLFTLQLDNSSDRQSVKIIENGKLSSQFLYLLSPGCPHSIQCNMTHVITNWRILKTDWRRKIIQSEIFIQNSSLKYVMWIRIFNSRLKEIIIFKSQIRW